MRRYEPHTEITRCSIPLIRVAAVWQGPYHFAIKMRKHEIRCGKCNRLLAKGQAHDLEIKCPRCGVFNHLSATSTDNETHEARKEPEVDSDR